MRKRKGEKEMRRKEGKFKGPCQEIKEKRRNRGRERKWKN